MGMKNNVVSMVPIQIRDMNLQVVILDCAYDTIHDEQTQKLLGKITSFKIKSYQEEYPYGVLPVDSTDFVCAHVILCEKRENELDPIMGFKLITYSQCKTFHLKFPAYEIFSKETLDVHRKALDLLVSGCEKNNEKLLYGGSWTFRPDVRKNKVLVKLCYDLSVALLVKYCQENEISKGIIFASLRFKVDRFHKFMGLTDMTYEGKILPHFELESFFNELLSTSLLEVEKFSENAQKLAMIYQRYWDERLAISRAPAATNVAQAA